VARVALLIDAACGHGGAQVREGAEHAPVPEPLRDRLGDAAVLDREQGARRREQARQLRRHLDGVVGLRGEDDEIERVAADVRVDGRGVRHVDRHRASDARQPQTGRLQRRRRLGVPGGEPDGRFRRP
jgi:hypothetical protein